MPWPRTTSVRGLVTVVHGLVTLVRNSLAESIDPRVLLCAIAHPLLPVMQKSLALYLADGATIRESHLSWKIQPSERVRRANKTMYAKTANTSKKARRT